MGAASLLGPVYPLFRALSGRLKFTVRRHKFKQDSLFMRHRSPLQSFGRGRQKSIPPQDSGLQKWRPPSEAFYFRLPPRTLWRGRSTTRDPERNIIAGALETPSIFNLSAQRVASHSTFPMNVSRPKNVSLVPQTQVGSTTRLGGENISVLSAVISLPDDNKFTDNTSLQVGSSTRDPELNINCDAALLFFFITLKPRVE